MDMVSQNDRHETPDLNPTALAMAYAAATLEELHPGFLDRWVTLTEDESAQIEVRRIREPAPNPATSDLLRRTTALVRSIRFVALAHMHGEAPCEAPRPSPSRPWWRGR